MKKVKVLLASLLSITVVLGTVVPSYAAEPVSEVKIEIEATDMNVSVTVPSTLPIVFNADGTNTFADNYQNVAADADYLTIYLGINDSHHRPNAYGSDGEDTTGEITLGTIADNTTATYYGAWNVILTWLITNRPNLKIGIIVTNAAETDEYRVASIAIAKKFGIPYIDLNGDERTPCMIRSTNADVASDVRTLRTNNWRISSSNSHPNEACHVYESTIIENFLRSL
jgi:lysophospholipase L1-like esterase